MPAFAVLTAEWLETWSEKECSLRRDGKTRLDQDMPAVGNIPIHQLKAPALIEGALGIQDDRDAEDIARRAPQTEKHPLRLGSIPKRRSSDAGRNADI
jgi:hypothetical protein